MKIRDKTNGTIKEFSDADAQEILQDSDFEQVIDEASAPQGELPLTSRLMQGELFGIPQVQAGVSAGVQKLKGSAAPIEDLYKQTYETPSDTEDIVRGVVQGGTIGFGDEAVGAIGATGQKLKGLVTGEQQPDWTDLYRQYQEAEQALNKRSEERSPWLYGGGQLAGGLGAGLLTGGVGGVTGASVRAAAKQGIRPLAGELGFAAAEGAALGGIAAAGTSESNVDSIESRAKLVEDIKSGAKMGGIVGASIPAAIGLGGAAKDAFTGYAKQRPFVRQMMEAYNRGKTNKPILRTEDSLDSVQGELGVKKDAFGQKILGADTMLSDEYGQVLKDATAAGVKIPMQQPTITSVQSINNLMANDQVLSKLPEAAELNKIIGTFMTGTDLSPQEAVALKSFLKDKVETLEIPNIRRITQQIINDIDNGLKTMSGGFGAKFEKANQLIAGYRGAVTDPLLGGKLSDVPHNLRSEKITEAGADILGKVGLPGTVGLSSRAQLNQVYTKLQDLETKNPGLLNRLGIGSVDDLKTQIQTDSDTFALVRQILGHEPQAHPGSVLKSNLALTGATTGIGRIMGGVQGVGRIARKAGQLYDIPFEEVSTLGNNLLNSNNKQAQNVGQYLIDAAQNQDVFKKNSALFIINQNPALRDLVSGLLGGSSSEE